MKFNIDSVFVVIYFEIAGHEEGIEGIFTDRAKAERFKKGISSDVDGLYYCLDIVEYPLNREIPGEV